MNILVIGKGGREHALVYALAHSKSTSKLFAIPGNPGIARYAQVFPTISQNDFPSIIHIVKEYSIDLVVVGPEEPLAKGITNHLEKFVPVFGPSQEAAQLEASKAFAKQTMQAAGIPTAKYAVFTKTQYDQLRAYLRNHPYPAVIKADGLAAGKGVTIVENYEEAQKHVTAYFAGKFGTAGMKVVIEEYLSGYEVSIFAITDGTDYLILAPSQDHKRAYDGDRGPNTGGMGAYAPTPLVNNEMIQKIETRIIQPLLSHMSQMNMPYKGCLYCGLMIVGDSPYVLEFNVRFGDPEAQVVLPIIQGDIAELFLSVANGKLNRTAVESVQSQCACCVVLASEGYPEAAKTGKEITGIERAEALGAIVFHAGTSLGQNGKLYTSGGRVLGVTGLAQTLENARTLAYRAVQEISFDGMWYRSDIALKALHTQ